MREINIYHPPEATDTPPVGRVSVVEESEGSIISAEFLGEVLSEVFVEDVFFYRRRLNRAVLKGVDRVRHEADMTLEYIHHPDAVSI